MRKWRLLATLTSTAVLAGLLAAPAAGAASMPEPAPSISVKSGPAPSSPSSSASPSWILTCYTEADKPYIGRDGKLYGWALFWCDGMPDDVYMTVQLQRFDPVRGIWINSGAPQTDITPFVGTFRMPDVLACAAGAPSRLYRTRSYMRALHGNWDSDFHESATMRAYC